MLVCCLVLCAWHGGSTSLIGGDVVMVDMIFTVLLFSVLVALVSTSALCESSRDVPDVFCFLVMLVVGVALILVFVVKGF